MLSLVWTVRNIWPCPPSGCFHRGLLLLCITVCNMLNPVRIMSRVHCASITAVRDITRLINNVMQLCVWKRQCCSESDIKKSKNISNEASSPVICRRFIALFCSQGPVIQCKTNNAILQHKHCCFMCIAFYLLYITQPLNLLGQFKWTCMHIPVHVM